MEHTHELLQGHRSIVVVCTRHQYQYHESESTATIVFMLGSAWANVSICGCSLLFYIVEVWSCIQCECWCTDYHVVYPWLCG